MADATKTPNLAELRRDYQMETLDEKSVDKNPIKQFEYWFEEALKSEILEPNAMVLSTVGQGGRPSARVVLLKGIESDGFVFFTNYQSQKGQELIANPFAALTFNWLDLQRQVRIGGTVQKLTEEASTAYFQSRPKSSQIGAWASMQSSPIPSREILEEKVAALEAQYQTADVLPKPPFWGGFILWPEQIEFWQGRASRLHDRIVYNQTETGKWQIQRLSP